MGSKERSLLREIEKRIINSFMDFILLAMSGNGDCFSGYEAIKYIHKQFHFLPSPGTVYSHLYAMESAGWLRGVEENKRRVYYLTENGLEFAQSVFSNPVMCAIIGVIGIYAKAAVTPSINFQNIVILHSHYAYKHEK
jgi:DNA-binding PadR family transcriptional regulator